MSACVLWTWLVGLNRLTGVAFAILFIRSGIEASILGHFGAAVDWYVFSLRAAAVSGCFTPSCRAGRRGCERRHACGSRGPGDRLSTMGPAKALAPLPALLMAELGQSFKTTNVIESVHAAIGERTDKVDHWRNSNQLQRW